LALPIAAVPIIVALDPRGTIVVALDRVGGSIKVWRVRRARPADRAGAMAGDRERGAPVVEIVLIGQAEVDAALREYPKKASRALVRAMNRALTSGRTLMVQRIAADTGLRSGDIKKAMALRNASAQSLEARLGVGLKRIPLISFNARGQEPSRGKGRGVSYRLKGGIWPDRERVHLDDEERPPRRVRAQPGSRGCPFVSCSARRSGTCSRSIGRRGSRG
jgi:hypothetical protein